MPSRCRWELLIELVSTAIMQGRTGREADTCSKQTGHTPRLMYVEESGFSSVLSWQRRRYRVHRNIFIDMWQVGLVVFTRRRWIEARAKRSPSG